MNKLVPLRALLLCEKIDETNKKGNIIIPSDKTKSEFSIYKILAVGDEVKDFYKKGDRVIADSEHVNYLVYDGNSYYIIDDGFIACKIK